MKLDNNKELDPVFFGYNAAILRENFCRSPYERCFHYHWHERMELILIREGSIKVNFGVKEAIIESGNVIIIPPYRLHGGFANENGAVFQTVMFDISMYFNNTPASEVFLIPIANLRMEFDYFSSNADLLKAMEELFKLRQNKEPTSVLFVSSAIYKILGLLCKHCIVSEKTAYSASSDKKINDILTYIDNNLSSNLTLKSLAQRFGYSNEYLCRKFKSTTGLTPNNYIKLMRLEKSKKLLHESNEKIGNIATICGFPDFSYFCRCFKAAYKITPNEYIQNKKIASS